MKFGCLSNEQFAIEVSSDTREDVSYEVSIRNTYYKRKDKVLRAWRCSCPGWMAHHVTKPGYECKHIRRVKARNYCGWKQSIHGGKPVIRKDEGNENTDYLCPACGNLAYPEDQLKVPE